MTSVTSLIILGCLAASGLLVAAEFRGWGRARAAFKIMASSAFVALAVQQGASASPYSQLILAALLLSWIGDVFLLSDKAHYFLPGIGSFLLAHVVFSVAFALKPLHAGASMLGLVLMGVFGLVVLAWLWRHLTGFYRVAVTAYVMAIVAMCCSAIGASAASGGWLLAAAAVAFAISDISVARDRFVAPGVVNRLWGLPLYYLAQLGLALTVGA